MTCEYHYPDSTRIIQETQWRPELVIVQPECCFRFVNIDDCPRRTPTRISVCYGGWVDLARDDRTPTRIAGLSEER